MRILVTGSRGFVGSETVRLLESKGHQVVHFDLMDGLDIRDKDQLSIAVGQMEYTYFGSKTHLTSNVDRILHLAAIARFDEADADPILTHETNVIGTMNVVDVAKKHHIPLVFASTGSAYMAISGTPPITEEFPIKGNSVYGCSKALADMYVQTHTPHIILRYAHIYGAEKRWHGAISGFLSRIDHDMQPTLYGGAQSNDFVAIQDIAQANLRALEAPWDAWNHAYNIGTGKEITTQEVFETLKEETGYKGDIIKLPQRPVDAERFVFDISKARKKLGYEPEYDFVSGLRLMLSQMGYGKN